MIDHLGKRLVPSGQTVLLDFLYSKLEKKTTKKTNQKKKKKVKISFFSFYPEQLDNTNLQAPPRSSTGRSFTTVSSLVPHIRASMGMLPTRPSVRPSVRGGVLTSG